MNGDEKWDQSDEGQGPDAQGRECGEVEGPGEQRQPCR